MTAAQLAKKLAAERTAAEAEKIRIEQANREYEEERKEELRKHVYKTLSEFEGLNGIEQRGAQLFKGKTLLASVGVAWKTWEFQGSDESPVVDCAGHCICWNIEKGGIFGEGQTQSTEEFDKRFGQAMARYL